jgi:hypothetical protein
VEAAGRERLDGAQENALALLITLFFPGDCPGAASGTGSARHRTAQRMALAMAPKMNHHS